MSLCYITFEDTNKVMIRKKAEQSVRIYQQWCDALRLPVCRAVHRGLMTSKIRIPHRKLGAAAMKPVANALLVRIHYEMFSNVKNIQVKIKI